MKKVVCAAVIFVLVVSFPAGILADCVSQYCICDGQMHDCSFTDADCQALCGGGAARYDTGYHESNTEMAPLYLGFAVAFVVIGVVLYFSGAFNENNQSHTGPSALKVEF